MKKNSNKFSKNSIKKKKYERILKKIEEIVNCLDVKHYKNLRYELSEFKRVHIDKSFVLVFKYKKSYKKIVFYDFDHHDKIYSK